MRRRRDEHEKANAYALAEHTSSVAGTTYCWTALC